MGSQVNEETIINAGAHVNESVKLDASQIVLGYVKEKE